MLFTTTGVPEPPRSTRTSATAIAVATTAPSTDAARRRCEVANPRGFIAVLLVTECLPDRRTLSVRHCRITRTETSANRRTRHPPWVREALNRSEFEIGLLLYG